LPKAEDGYAVSKATIITSQLPIEHWHAWIGDATIADAIMDRLMQKNHRLTLAGESLRQKPKTTKQEKKLTHRDRCTYNLRAQHVTLRNWS
jgi:DNA replication protein DnaC